VFSVYRTTPENTVLEEASDNLAIEALHRAWGYLNDSTEIIMERRVDLADRLRTYQLNEAHDLLSCHKNIIIYLSHFLRDSSMFLEQMYLAST